MIEEVHVTGGLLDALLDLADRREPSSVSAALAVTPAEDLVPAAGASLKELDPSTPVFTDFYLPSDGPAGRAVDAVFGVDVTVPHAQTQGRFVSHPLGELSVSTRDDLHEVVLVAVPPWKRDDVAAFNRSGTRLRLHVVEATPPDPAFEG